MISMKMWGAMMRIFISHSSKDKTRYSNEVANKIIEKLGRDSIVYDAITFEAGERSIDEINRTLQYTDLYVILLSIPAVESRWVKYELAEAHKRLDDHLLNRVFPLIIDEKLKYSDDRIPAWLKDYNLKYIARPAKAVKLIIERAKDIKWTRYPSFQYRQNIFVGRNDLVNDFELRSDDYNKPPLNSFIVSGIPNIGRRSLARHCLIKGTVIPQYYEFPHISLSYQESIEDFIIKINDLGFSEGEEIIKFSSMTLDQKMQIAIKLCTDIIRLSEIILIKDDGCLIDYRGNIAEWFRNILLDKALSERVVFVIITKYKTNYESIRSLYCATVLNVPELSLSERKGLLRRLAEMNKLDLTRDNLESISQHLTGYPAQIYYAISLIKKNGFPYLSRNFKSLTDYSEQEVSSMLEKYRDDQRVFNIVNLISKYDAISLHMLYEILETTPGYVDVYELLYQASFFELEGVNGEYIRLNEVIRNYILRTESKLLNEHKRKAHELIENMFVNDKNLWNSNDFLLGMREKIKAGEDIPQEYAIPSMYLKSMSDLYGNMQYEDVIKLAKRALENINNIESKIIYEIRYLLCSALAKLKHPSFLTQVQHLEYDDKTFLLAFYYRQIGKNDRALERLNELLIRRSEMSKAKREKVLVLKNLQQYNEATSLARENYYSYSDNPYHIQAYFDCLINTYFQKPDDVLLEDLLTKLSRIQNEKAQSMYGRCYALFIAYVEQDEGAAINKIDEVINEFPKDKKYALMVKFDIAQLFSNINIMEDVIRTLKSENANSNSVILCESKLLASKSMINEAIKHFKRHITYFTNESKEAFCEKLKNYGSKFSPFM